jgi:aspartate kinase
MGIIVAKFGGWANASPERIKLAADLFENNPDRKVKVNSAIGKVEGLPKVTDLLTEGVEIHLLGGEFPSDILTKIKENHYQVFEPLGVKKDRIDQVLAILEGYIAKIEEYTPDHYRAQIIGSGEELFSRLDAIYLNEIRGIKAAYVDPRESGHYLHGHPLDGKTTKEAYHNLSNLASMEGIIVYPGFFAVDHSGRPMIYSRGGTDKTASDLAVALDAELYENWKDVDGIFSSDPRIVEKPLLMKEVTYKEIRELSYISFNVLHQEAMLPVMSAGIPICIKNLLNPQGYGTRIVEERNIDNTLPVAGIAHLENISFINIEKTLMNEEVGFANELLHMFREHRLSIEQITTGIDSICLVIAEKEFKEKTVHAGVSEGIRREIEPEEFIRWLKAHLSADKVEIRSNKALICVVGEGMRHSVGLLARVATVLSNNGINIELLDQGPSERNIIVGIDCPDGGDTAKKAVNILYKELFQ